MSQKIPHFKIAMVGSCRVGKTSIVQRYVNDQYTLNTISTTQSAFFQKKINVDNTEIILDIWDTAGQERYHSLAPMYYRDADGIIVVFDITDATSFTKAKQWVTELKEARSENQPDIIIAANKNDIQSLRVVDPDEVKRYGMKENLTIFEISAKTGCFINELFSEIGHRALLHQKPKEDLIKSESSSGCC